MQENNSKNTDLDKFFMYLAAHILKTSSEYIDKNRDAMPDAQLQMDAMIMAFMAPMLFVLQNCLIYRDGKKVEIDKKHINLIKKLCVEYIDAYYQKEE